MSREPPLPALLTGLPVYLTPSRLGLFVSRLLDTVIGAAGIATAVTLAISRRRPFLLTGVILATTPSVIAAMGLLGTSQLEVAAAAVLWVAVALLIDGERPTPRFMALTCIAAVLLVLSRPISFVFLGLAVITLILVGGRERLAPLARNRSVQLTAVLVISATVFSLAWYILVSPVPDPTWHLHLPRVTSLSQRLSIPLGSTQAYWFQAVGIVGSLTAPEPSNGYTLIGYTGPWWVVFAWTVLSAATAGIGLVFSNRRRLLGVSILLVALFVFPVIAQAVTLPTTWLYWQGRYDLATLAGVMIISASVLDHHVPGLRQLRRLSTTTLIAVPVLVAIFFIAALRRYAVGVDGSLNPFAWGNGWRPPLPTTALMALEVAALVATYGALYLYYRPLLPVLGDRGDPVPTGSR